MEYLLIYNTVAREYNTETAEYFRSCVPNVRRTKRLEAQLFEEDLVVLR